MVLVKTGRLRATAYSLSGAPGLSQLTVIWIKMVQARWFARNTGVIEMQFHKY